MRPRPPEPPGIERARQRLAVGSGDLDLSALRLNEGELAALIDEPGALARLRNVRRLDLSDNDLDTRPPWLGELEALEELIVRRTRLKSVPPELGRASRLTALDLTADLIDDLPGELATLQHLRRLELRANRPRPRWRSLLTDRIGESLRSVRARPGRGRPIKSRDRLQSGRGLRGEHRITSGGMSRGARTWR